MAIGTATEIGRTSAGGGGQIFSEEISITSGTRRKAWGNVSNGRITAASFTGKGMAAMPRETQSIAACGKRHLCKGNIGHIFPTRKMHTTTFKGGTRQGLMREKTDQKLPEGTTTSFVGHALALEG